LTEVQGQERIGSIGCLVHDGTHTFALTSRHVVGEAGAIGYTIDRGQRRTVVTSDKRGEHKVSFSEAYPGWPGLRTFVNVDAGLFKVDDLSEWTAQIYGIGRIGELVDLNVDTLSLDLIGTPVRAMGGSSGPLEGQISSLFYRYRSVGGFDYVAEFLIGPRTQQKEVTTRPGDSGTIWFWDHPQDEKNKKGKIEAGTLEYRPLAIQWGGHSFLEPGGQGVRPFALASSLATVCRLLNLDIIRDWDTDQSQYWGKVGHYKIGVSACYLLTDPKLAKLFKANAGNISLSDDDLRNGQTPKMGGSGFVALADVPDLVWRRTRQMDKANHFADMDEPGRSGQTLLELWDSGPDARRPAAWTEFYDELSPKRKDAQRGALPFRVQQMYEEMVGFIKVGDVMRYTCASGILAHYVGDACQPLHLSFLHHGAPGDADEKGVHEVYETKMLDKFRAEVIDSVNTQLNGRKASDFFKGGPQAADRVVDLMRATMEILPPVEVVDAYRTTKGRGQLSAMWEKLGKRTVTCMARGALCLATIWESAWREGGGSRNIKPKELMEFDKKELMRTYNTKSFCESKWLKNM
jgi:hypothetical protein